MLVDLETDILRFRDLKSGGFDFDRVVGNAEQSHDVMPGVVTRRIARNVRSPGM